MYKLIQYTYKKFDCEQLMVENNLFIQKMPELKADLFSIFKCCNAFNISVGIPILVKVKFILKNYLSEDL